jgi:lipopolysaccharide transport system permease protein
MATPLTAAWRSSARMIDLLVSSRALLRSITRIELQKKYAGSVLGLGWMFLQPALLLSVYLFIYLVVFKVKFPGLGNWDYVLYVFTGLVPYMGFMEALTLGGTSLKQNMHFVKNVMLPMELIPVRSVLVGMASQAVSLGILLVLIGATGQLSPWVVLLPVVVLLQLAALFGLVWVLAGLTVVLPDVSYIINLLVFLLMWLSPIGFTPAMVPPQYRFIIYLNPVSYMIEAYRAALLRTATPHAPMILAYAVMSIAVFAAGAALFRGFKSMLVDLE